MDIRCVATSPGRHTRIASFLGSLITQNGPSRIRAGFAYATDSGVSALLAEIHQSPSWRGLTKQFIIGISQGISEPNAIRKLSGLNNSETRIYIPTRRLERSSLYSTPLFHPKFVCFDGTSPNSTLFVSSGNLTGAAVGPMVRNFELSVSIELERSQEGILQNEFEPWWNGIWQAARPVTNAVLARYAELREETFVANPDTLALLDPPPGIDAFKHLWIEVGAASGIERHQVEFTEALAVYFGPVMQHRVNLTLRKGADAWNDRPFSHKRTTFGVDIWRLGTPTLTMGGEAIQNRAIRFTRTTRPLDFEFEVADLGSPAIRAWEQAANLYGHMGRTRGSHPRRYGIY